MDADRPRSSSKSSPWIWVGCGCGILVALVMAAISGVTWFGYKAGKRMEKAREDPVAREQMTREILAYDELPSGYYSGGAFSIPMLTDVALFSDQPPKPGEREHEMGDHGFIFLSMHGWMADQEELTRFLQGKAKRPGWLGKSGADSDIGEVLGRGKVESGGRELLYMATRGDVNVQGRDREGLVTWLSVDCPSDRRVRLGLWFTPDPAPGKPLQGADLAGTAADPEAIRAFAEHFRFCG